MRSTPSDRRRMTSIEYRIRCEEKAQVLFIFAEFISQLLWDSKSVRVWWLDSINPLGSQLSDDSDIWMNKFKHYRSLEDISDENSRN